MMRWLAVFLFFATAWLQGKMALAQQVSVTTGDHPDFTRVVLESPGLTGWRLVRLTDGYALRLRRPASFDLDDAFRVITRDRLTGLAALDDGRGLRLTLGCTCHAVGFDYRPGIVVIDLRDGPPPDGSSFELSDTGERAPPLQRSETTTRPMARALMTWNWAEQSLKQTMKDPALPIAAPPLADAQTLALRDTLLKQFADGASRGLVAPVADLPIPAKPDGAAPQAARVGLLALPGVAGLTPQDTRPTLTATGAECIAPERISLPDWGNPDLPAAAQLNDLTGFLGEFDRADPDALTVAIRRQLWLGFGVETVALVDTFAADMADADLWRSMARGVDGDTHPQSAFAGMTMCDGPAAFWAAVTLPFLSPPEANAQAILRSFSALPPHLRRSLGPALAERFLQAGDGSTAQSLRDAMLRADPAAGALVDARIALRSDQPVQAEAQAEAALSAGGPDSAAAFVTLIEARFQMRKPLSPDDVTAVAAMRQEQPDDPTLARAAILSQALSGAFDAAFADLETAPEGVLIGTAPDVWALLAEIGADSALINHGVLGASPPPPTAEETRLHLAQRLTDLGFGAAAQIWLGQSGDPVALAAAELTDGKARAALTRLAGRPGADATALRAQALLALGDAATAADLLADGEDAELATSARIRSRDWAFLQQNGPPQWQGATAELQPTLLSGGPLTDGRAILTQSAATRAAVAALLETTPPAPAQ
jgi:hypothetical protein